MSVISDNGAKFASQFWRLFKKGWGTQIKLKTTFHPPIDGQEENNYSNPKRYVKSMCDRLQR